MKTLAMAALLSLPIPLAAQGNLVPNGSFEEYTTCPDYFSQWSRVVYWLSPYTQSSDYFNGCADGLICSVPLNQFGYQAPADGQAYMGLATYGQGDPTYREVIATELLTPLVIGVPVCVSFKAACGGYGSSQANSAAWKARGPGLRFFTELPTDWGALLYPNDAVVHMDTVLGDTADWVDISGTFVPDSAYRFLAITNFYADSLSWPQPLINGGGLPGAYAFVDDVRVSFDLQFCEATGVKPNGLLRAARAYPQPCMNEFMLDVGGTLPNATAWTITDLDGREVLTGVLPTGASRASINTARLPAGIYLLQLQDKKVAFAALRIVKVSSFPSM